MSVADKFDRAFEAVIGHEGGLSLVSSDPGNWTGGKVGSGVLKGTKYGISAASYPDLDIRNLTMADAAAIYRVQFWDAVRGDELPYRTALNVFDGAVNSGPKQSILWLQRAAGVAEDGIFGPMTLAAASKRSPLIAARYNAARLEFLTSLKTWPTFGKGWSRRIATNLRT